MKKAFCLLLTSIIATVQGYSQNIDEEENIYSKVGIGIKAGIVFSNFNMKSEPRINHSGALRGRIAIFVHIPAKNAVCFRPEIAITGKGAKYELTFPADQTITYLELPLNILYKIPSSKSNFLIGGGPAPAYSTGENIYDPFYLSGIKKFDLGINAAVIYERPIGFSVNLHYTYGLLNITNDKTSISAIHNRCFGISLGYLF